MQFFNIKYHKNQPDQVKIMKFFNFTFIINFIRLMHSFNQGYKLEYDSLKFSFLTKTKS